jgi:3-methyladenine DNA glycosylase AlkD
MLNRNLMGPVQSAFTESYGFRIFDPEISMIMSTILQDLRNELLRNANEKDRLSGKRFFREEVNLMGIKAAVVDKISKAYFKALGDVTKADVFAFCEDLFSSGIMEESFIACHWSYMVRMQYQVSDFSTFDRWVDRYVNNWATCDTLCNHSVGTLVEMYPETVNNLKKWALSGNRWVKRASAVSLIIPARKGRFTEDIFEIAGLLLTDPDDMVQKGYGWMLKSASQAYPREVFEFVVRNKSVMPRTALRYAIEKMPEDMRSEAMKK